MIDLQKLVDTMNETSRLTRSEYHLTLGALVEALKGVPTDTAVRFDFPGYPGVEDSYRGYYSDLAFRTRKEPVIAHDFREQCKKAIGSTYVGYKGGNFVMSEDTPLWASEYGESSGVAIIGIDLQNDFVLITKEVG